MKKHPIVLITGAKEGIGYQTALQLARRKWQIILADRQDLKETQQQIITQTNNENVFIQYLNLASFQSIRNAACHLMNNFKCLDAIINNAGIFWNDKMKTENNLNRVLQVNHYGPYFLTCLLTGKENYDGHRIDSFINFLIYLDLLKYSNQGRIIYVSSSGAFFHTLNSSALSMSDNNNMPNLNDSLSIYYNTKLCNMIISQEFARRLNKFNITSNCLHPGMSNTKLLLREIKNNRCVANCVFYQLLKMLTQDVKKSAALITFLTTSKTISKTTGRYFVNYQIHRQPDLLDNRDYCHKIWQQAETLVPLLKNEKIPA